MGPEVAKMYQYLFEKYGDDIPLDQIPIQFLKQLIQSNPSIELPKQLKDQIINFDGEF